MRQVEINFIGIGAQRSGTTWLFNNLNKLPDFTLPIIKEFHYFDRDDKYPTPNKLGESNLIKRLLNWNWTKKSVLEIVKLVVMLNLHHARWMIKWYYSNYNDKWYVNLFHSLNGLKGEITPGYSMLEVDDIQRMYNIAPNAKLILILRNPVDRAWSHYCMSKQKTNDFLFNEKNGEILKFINSEEQLKRSDYLSTLQNYSKVFPKDQILICFYDAIIDCPKKLLQDIVIFIGGDPANIEKYCDLEKKINPSKQVNCPIEILEYLKNKYYDQIKQLSDKYGGYFTVWFEKTYGKKNNDNDLFPTFRMDF